MKTFLTVLITAALAVTATWFIMRKPDSTAPPPYDSAFVPPSPGTPATPPGVNWTMFHGEWPWMPDFRTLSGGAAGVSDSIDLSMPHGDHAFGVEFNTFFKAPTDGTYTFTIDSDGGAMLFVHDIRVIDEPKTPEPGTLSGNVLLKAGWHPLRLLYRQVATSPSLRFAISEEKSGTITLDHSSLRQNLPAK